MIHASDCAVNNAPALPVGPCDCGLELALDAARHGLVAPLISWTRSHGFDFGDVWGKALVEAEAFPANRLIMDAAAANLPDPHEPVALLGLSEFELAN